MVKLESDPDDAAKHRPATMRISSTLSVVKTELKVAGLLDAQVVEAGDEPGDADGKDLRPEQR